jgi:hypothetical protein
VPTVAEVVVDIHRNALLKIREYFDEIEDIDNNKEYSLSKIKEDILDYIKMAVGDESYFKKCCSYKPTVQKDGKVYCIKCYNEEFNNVGA